MSLNLVLSTNLERAGVRRITPVLGAVSGGADSVALLYALVAIGQRTGVAHVDHGLRPDAAADADFVASLAARLGLPAHVERVDALRDPGSNESPEARARRLRYAALEARRRDVGYAWVLTAHTLEDQAETVLLRAVRGSGLAGLRGIEPRSAGRRVLRPLLDVRRSTLRASLEQHGRTWREDATNADVAVPRNRIRHEVLPALERAHPGATAKLAELAELARRELDERERLAAELARRVLRSADAGEITGHAGRFSPEWWVDPSPLQDCSAALRGRVWKHVWERVWGDVPVTRTHLERIDAFVAGGRSARALSLPANRALVRRSGRFWLGRESRASSAS